MVRGELRGEIDVHTDPGLFQDVEVFKDANFNAVEWINKCYDDEIATSNVDKEVVVLCFQHVQHYRHISVFQVFVNSMVDQLEALIQSVNSSLEKTSETVIASMPKIFQNVQVIDTPNLE